jgi:uncharacterized protein YceK
MKIAFMSRAVLLAAVLALDGCGSSSSSQSPGPSPSAPATQSTVSVPAHGFVSAPLTTTRTGTLTVSLSLTRNIVVAGLFTSACTAGRSGCAAVTYTASASSDFSTTLTASGAAAGSYVIVLGNVSGATQSVGYSVN